MLKLTKFSSARPFSSNTNWKEFLTDEAKKQFLQNTSKYAIKIKRDITKPSAVLIPIVKIDQNNYGLLYTLRSTKLRHHVRQVSFPGGKMDANETYIDCALRETEEEIGINANDIKVWGTGSMTETYNSAGIMPVIGVIENYQNLELKISSDEVEQVFTLSFNQLCSKENQRYTQSREWYTLPAFTGGAERVWGITAILTHQFLMAFFPRNVYNNRLKFITSFKEK